METSEPACRLVVDEPISMAKSADELWRMLERTRAGSSRMVYTPLGLFEVRSLEMNDA